MIQEAIRSAQEAHRAIIEQTYIGRCSVIERQKVKKENGVTGFEEVTVLEEIPCFLNYETVPAAEAADPASGINQGITLLLAPEVAISAGSKLIVTQNGVTREYTQSGVPAVYVSHQEINLELFERWA